VAVSDIISSPPRPPRERHIERIQVGLTPTQLEHIRARAAQEDRTVSSLCRYAVTSYVERARQAVA
jgi:hypothetical protein